MKKGGKFDEKSLQRGSLKDLVTLMVANFCVELGCRAASVAPPSISSKQKSKEDIEIDQLNSKRKQLREKDNKTAREKLSRIC